MYEQPLQRNQRKASNPPGYLRRDDDHSGPDPGTGIWFSKIRPGLAVHGGGGGCKDRPGHPLRDRPGGQGHRGRTGDGMTMWRRLFEAYPWLEDLFNWGVLTISGLAFLLALAVYLGRAMG